MLKQHKKKLIISSLLILLPILVGLLLWDQLPDTMATHWGTDGQVDGWGSKTFAIFGMPLLLLAMHWFCLWITSNDPGQKNQNKKAFGLIFWMMPMVSLFASAVMYGTALGSELNIGSIVFAMVGLMFMGIGNYMPKIKQNYTLGVKVIWALCNEENWNATHRFSGKLWVAGGLATILLVFFPIEKTFGILFGLLMVMAFLPMLYSYLYYKKQCARGEGYALDCKPMDKTTQAIYRWSLLFVVLILIFVCIMMFTGEINYVYNADSFTIDPSQWNDLTVEYAAIESIEYREEAVPGTREWGFGSGRLLMGTFKNDEFGMYTRYTYTKCESAVILTVQGKTLVLAAATPEETLTIYETLLNHISNA